MGICILSDHFRRCSMMKGEKFSLKDCIDNYTELYLLEGLDIVSINNDEMKYLYCKDTFFKVLVKKGVFMGEDKNFEPKLELRTLPFLY